MSYKSLKKRIMLKFGAIIATILLLFSAIFYTLFWQKSSLLVKEQLFISAEKIERYIEKKQDLLELRIPFAIYQDGKLLFKSENFQEPPFHREFYMPLIPLTNNLAFFQYTIEESNTTIIAEKLEVDAILENIIITICTITLAIFTILLFVTNSIVNTILIPINQLNRDIKRVSIDNFKSSLAKTKFNDEIAKLRDNFNAMVKRLNSGVARLKRANDTIAHELKTPIAIMQGEIELALTQDRTSSYYKERFLKLQKQLQSLELLVKTLLILSRYSKDEIKEQLELCDFNTVLLAILEELEPFAAQKSIELDVVEFTKASKLSNRELLNCIMKNIIENAIKYSHQNSKVSISLSQKEDKIYFRVKDNGIGIAKEDLNNITERFFKVAHNDNSSFGLGLSIVKEATKLLDAKLTVQSTLHKGSEFIVEF